VHNANFKKRGNSTNKHIKKGGKLKLRRLWNASPNYCTISDELKECWRKTSKEHYQFSTNSPGNCCQVISETDNNFKLANRDAVEIHITQLKYIYAHHLLVISNVDCLSY